MAENDNIIIVDDISELDNYNVSTMDSESGTEYYNVAYWDPKDKQWKIYDEEKIKELRTEPLKLAKINENGTIGEMIETINENFRNLAAHGGGPSGQDGANGERGADGTNVEYIYCLCDEMEEDKQYPKNSGEKADLFNDLQGSDTFTFTGKDGTTQTVWYNHAQPISKEHKNEYMLVRYKSYAGLWAYEEKPVLWSHWGETGVDGDGVEYIFLATKAELTGETFLKREDMDDFQKTVFNMNDFYPNSEWFNNDNKTKVKKEFEKKGLSISDSDFNTRWSNCFEFGGENRSLNWTDEPTGSGPEYPFEYVSIRRSNRDENDNLVWNDFSEPAVWSNYSYPSRTFIIYCNTNPEDSEDDEPEAPKVGQGWWDYETDTLVFDKPGHKIPSGWTDDNNNEEDKITWICSGIFKYTGENVSWSNPIRITGKNGQNGVDGESVEFIYALDNDPKYPSDPRERENLFDNVEDPKNEGSYDWSEGDDHTTWYDRAQAITAKHPNEYVVSRHKAPRSNTWVYDTEPVLWAHWGEDGTDGDGIEYIFIVKNAESYDGTDITESDWENLWSFKNDTARTAYSMNDFVPNVGWFSNDHKTAVQTKMTKAGKTFVENDWNSMKTTFSLEWSDNPVGIDATNKYQYVSIRKSDDGVWGPFSYPKLWSKYNLTVFKSFAFTATSLFDDISSVVPTGGTFDSPVPTNPKTLNWYDVPTTEDGKPQIWMVSATFNDQVNGPVSGWSHPKKMNDTAEFQVEWSSADLTGTALANLRTDLGSDTYNLNHFYTNGELDEDAWRDEVETNLNVRFSDSSEGAVLMATCQYAGGVWTNWELVRVKGENGNDGQNGQPGADGNDGTPGIGYQYCYVRYTNADESSYGGATSCTVTQASAGDDPVFKIGTATVASASVPQGADADHTYEYRSERSGYEGNWSLWSTPVTIAKYLDAGDLDTTIKREVTSAVETATNSITSNLNAVSQRVNTLGGYFNTDGSFCGSFASETMTGVINAVVTNNSFTSAVSTHLNGMVASQEGVTSFADWINNTNGNIATAQASLSTLSDSHATLQNTVTGVDTRLNSLNTAFGSYEANASMRFASIEQGVANAKYLTDEDGYFLVEDSSTTPPTRRRAKKDDGITDASMYVDIRDADKSKLILQVTEIASIAQTVTDKTSLVEIIAAVNDTSGSMSSTGLSIYAGIFAQANADNGSTIALNADAINIDANHRLTLSAGEFEIHSNNFTIASTGEFSINSPNFTVTSTGDVSLGSITLNTGNTRIDSEGNLYAQNAVISGEIQANEFLASTTTSISTSFTGHTITGTAQKTTQINGESLIITADANITDNSDTKHLINSLYIKLVDVLDNTDPNTKNPAFDDQLICVPVLCMNYNGVEYVLSPASWMTNSVGNETNMRWVKYGVYQYTFTLPNVITDDTYLYQGGDFYIFRPGYGIEGTTGDAFINLHNNNDDAVCRFRVVNWGTQGGGIDSSLNADLIAAGLLPANNTGDDGVYVPYNVSMGSYILDGGSQTRINSTNISKYQTFIDSSGFEYALKITVPAISSSDLSDGSDYIVDGFVDYMNSIIVPKEGSADEYEWTGNDGDPSLSGSVKLIGLGNYLPFMIDYMGSSNTYTLNIEIYPKWKNTPGYFDLDNTVESIYIKYKLNAYKDFSSNPLQVTSRSMSVTATATCYISTINYDLSFDAVLIPQTPFTLNSSFPLSETQKDAVIDVVKDFLQNSIDYTVFSALTEDRVAFTAQVFGSLNTPGGNDILVYKGSERGSGGGGF